LELLAYAAPAKPLKQSGWLGFAAARSQLVGSRCVLPPQQWDTALADMRAVWVRLVKNIVIKFRHHILPAKIQV